MPSELLETLTTTTDRELLRSELEQLKASIFKLKTGGLEETLKTKVRANVAEVVQRELRQNEAQKTGLNPESYLQEVIGQLDTIPVLTLTIAFEPTTANLEKWSAQACKLAEQNIILEVKVKPEVVGGANIVWNGRYEDATLQNTFNQALAQQIEKMLGLQPVIPA